MEVEKLCKALESLNVSSGSASSSQISTDSATAQPTKRPSFIKRRTSTRQFGLREEKIHLCSHIADALSAGNVKTYKDFPAVLVLAIDSILECCDDPDASVRLSAEESLNRILQEHIAAHPVTILVDLFKEIKKNGKGRCVRAAWTRFAFFANYIKPQRFRCRAFAANFVPCLLLLIRREEEILHDALSEGLPQILKILGIYLTEAEIKSLARAFLPSLSSESGPKRRSAAACVVEICRHSKKPTIAGQWLLRGLLGMISSSADNAPTALYGGVLIAVRNTLVFLRSTSEKSRESGLELDLQIRVLHLLTEFCDNADHNVQGHALEAMHALLDSPDVNFSKLLTTSGGIATYQLSPVDSNVSSDFSLDFDSPEKAKSEDMPEGTDNITAEALGIVDNLLLGPKGSSESIGEVSDSLSILSSVEDAFHVADDSDFTVDDESPLTEGPDASEAGKIDPDSEFEKRSEDSREVANDDMDMNLIGSLYNAQHAPVDYLARYLISRFLLREDSKPAIKLGVRVSVQSLALSCLYDVVSLMPAVFSTPRTLQTESTTFISDVMMFLNQTDPLLKAYGALLSASYVAAVTEKVTDLTGDDCDSREWSQHLSQIVENTLEILRQESALACRLALEALQICVFPLLYSADHVDFGLRIVLGVLDLLNDPKTTYWLLKTEIFKFLRHVPLYLCACAEDVFGRRRKDKILFRENVISCLIKHLGDPDVRIHQAAAETLCWVPFSFGFPRLGAVEMFRDLGKQYDAFLKKMWTDFTHSIQTGLIFPFNVHDLPKALPGVEDVASMIVGRLFDLLIQGIRKENLAGKVGALLLLSKVFAPTVYTRCWFGLIEDTDLAMEKYSSPAVGTLKRLLETVMYSSSAADLQLHAQALLLLGNLASGLAFSLFSKIKTAPPAGIPWTSIGDSAFHLLVENLLKHLSRVLNVVKSVTEGQKVADAFPSLKSISLLPNSPGITSTLRRRQDTLRRGEKKSKLIFDLKGKANPGALHSSDVYCHVYDSVKKAWTKHRCQLSRDVHSDKFQSFTASVIICLSQISEILPADLISSHVEELVRYLRVTMNIDGRASVYCIEQLLRCLFACNLSQMDCYMLIKDARTHFAPLPSDADFLVAFAENYGRGSSFCPRFATLPVDKNLKSSIFNSDEWAGKWAHLMDSRRTENLEANFKSYSKEKRVMMSETIRQFEAVVIRALQLYTCTPLMDVQVQVLDLLVVLLQLHVNYGVLDGEHVFLKYVLKQIDLIELGEITETDLLLPYVFRFLIRLSHDKFIFQQNILTYGHVIQYCDSLMATSSAVQLAVLPVLDLLFDDAVYRKAAANAPGPEEREAQLEVILAMVYRCIPQPASFELLHKFLLYQLRSSAGVYEAKTRDLVENAFSRAAPDLLNFRTLHDFDQFVGFLDIVRSQALIESPAFARFFQDLVAALRRSGSTNLGALVAFAAIIDSFISEAVIQPLFKLFYSIKPNHPLEDLQESHTDAAAKQFVSVLSEVLDSLLTTKTATEKRPPNHQLFDFVHCTLLKSLAYFVQIVDHGPLKWEIRQIHTENRLQPDTTEYLPPVCMAAWMRFRYISTGCDLEPRFWNISATFPIEDHICDVMWNVIRCSIKTVGIPESPSGRTGENLPYAVPELALSVLEDYVAEQVSPVETELVQKFYGRSAALCLQRLFASAAKTEQQQNRQIVSLYRRPGALSIHFAFREKLTNSSEPTLDPNVLGEMSGLWGGEQYSALKRAVFKSVENDYSDITFPRSDFEVLTDENVGEWQRHLSSWVALNSQIDSADSIARLLVVLDEESLLTILTDRKFSPSLLRSCFKSKNWNSHGLSLLEDGGSRKLPHLFQAASFVLLEKIKELRAAEDEDEWTWLILASAFIEWGERLNQLENALPEDAVEDLVEFSLFGVKLIERARCHRVIRRHTLRCLLVCLENSAFSSWIKQNPENSDRIIHETYVIVNSDEQTSKAAPSPEEGIAEDHPPAESHKEIRLLTAWFEDKMCPWDDVTVSVIAGLARLPSVAEIIRVPPSVWASGWKPESDNSDPISIDFLQDPQILKEFVGRVCHYGWTNRRQFEEIWMAFLSVLSSVPVDEESAADEASRENTVTSRIAAGRVALRCITALLLESVLASHPGNPLRSRRNFGQTKSPHRHLEEYSRSICSRTKMVGAEDFWVQEFTCQPRRPPYFLYAYFDELNRPYCRWVMKSSPQTDDDNQIDLKSCLKFVMDLYGHWTSDEKLKKLSPYILDEVTKSTLHLSNIFHDVRNFKWMLGLVRQILRVKNVEESLFYGHLMDALGKALCAVDEDKESMTLLRKAAESKATQSLPNRVCGSRVVMRLLKQQVPGEPHKSLQWLMSLSTAMYEAECRNRIRCTDVLDLLFAILVTEIDFYVPKPKETINPYYDVLLQELRNAAGLPFPTLNGLLSLLGRHLIEKRLNDGIFKEQLTKAALESISLPPPRSLAVFGFLFSCLDNEWKTNLLRTIPVEDSSPSVADSHSDPLFIMAMEKLAVIHQRLHKSFQVEENILGKVFVVLLTSKMPLNEAVNRVMAEFQSCQPDQAAFVSRLVAVLFELLKKHRLDSVIDEWISLSFGNFANRSPPVLGIWSLACLFCASSSTCLAALFPYLCSRGYVEDSVLEEIFCKSGAKFISDTDVEETRKTFQAVAEAASKSSDVLQKFYDLVYKSRS